MRKILIGLLAATLSALAIGATTAPVTLLNPSGSTAGQAIVSTGPSTAPAWGNVTATALGPVAANTAIANVTGSSAAPAAAALPSCSTGNSALKYISGTGFSCGTAFALTSGNLSQFASTTSAQLLGVLSDETGSGAAVFGTSPTIASPTLSGTVAGTPTFSGAITFSSTITPSQTAGIVGTTTNNSANAGSVGEYISSSPAGISLTNATATNITSISLTAGDWDVVGNIYFSTGAGDTMAAGRIGISTTSATQPAIPLYSALGLFSMGPSNEISAIAPAQRISLSATTTVYLVATAFHSGGTLTGQGIIRARRVR
ncbi:hypothetical protein [Cupriavidus metallidurans]|uniref:hypothetical protein n=1 Tax=Cupriavidus metallidurans TaxID=119219 RepID=UPI0007638952|nr:hypothetical protein [Cupriavidus metallidurans]KWW37667.1 hypothetical protein AU374_01434 [Cupriavidus metallidurans]